MARRRAIGSSGVAACVLLIAAGGAAGIQREYESGGVVGENPCQEQGSARLRCPDLQMRRPYDIELERTPAGRALLRSASAIKVRGRGPVELHGRRLTGYPRKRV